MAKVFGAGAGGVKLIAVLIVLYKFNFSISTENVLSKTQKDLIPADIKNEYQSNSPNSQTETNYTENENITGTIIDTSSHNINEQRLLGVNGTGQRLDIPQKDKNPILLVSSEKKMSVPKKVMTNSMSTNISIIDTSEEKIIDSIDVPENETMTELQNHNMTVNVTTDHHDYYASRIYKNPVEAKQIWESMKNISPDAMLSESHRRAMTVELSFDFPFYGHNVRNITVATGGFLYTGEYVHSWLAATQYIAPLMANFDTRLSDNSFVRMKDNGTAFTVIWENVVLQEKLQFGKFTFSATLYKNGDIQFTYFSVPILVNAIQDDKHPVKVGLSDAYIIDKVVFFARRKTIYEYHRVNFANSEITNSTIIYLKALPTCLSYTDCNSCINHETSFNCAWCPAMNRCSTGTDRKKQEWLFKGCDRSQITDLAGCAAIGKRGNNSVQPNIINTTVSSTPSTSQSPSTIENTDEFSKNQWMDETTIKATKSSNNVDAKVAMESESQPKSMGLGLGLLFPVCLVLIIMLWILYAYKNPHTKSGQLLIQYRPSQWSWRRGEARYTAATIHM